MNGIIAESIPEVRVARKGRRIYARALTDECPPTAPARVLTRFQKNETAGGRVGGKKSFTFEENPTTVVGLTNGRNIRWEKNRAALLLFCNAPELNQKVSRLFKIKLCPAEARWTFRD